MIHFLVCVFFLFGAIQTCQISELDSQFLPNYCSEKFIARILKPGDFCLVKPERVRPTQVFVGKVEMECTKTEMESMNSSSLRYFLMENPVPTIVGPGGEFYITDHHHFATALFQAFLDFKRPSIHRVLYACIQADYSKMNITSFWRKMQLQNFVYLEDEKGNPIVPANIPPNLKLMADNPFRTFASWLRHSFAFIKCGTKKTRKLSICDNTKPPYFIECAWANHIRKKFPLEHFPTEPDVRPPLNDFIYRAALQLQTEALATIFPQAIKYALSGDSKHMPGWNSVTDILPPKMIKLDHAGCPKE